MTRAVVFDCDGLLLDSEAIYRSSWRTAAAAQGVHIDDATYRTFIGRRIALCEQEVATLAPGFDLPRFQRDWRAGWQALAERGVDPKPGADALIAALAAAGVPLAVATSSQRPQARAALGAWWPRFQVVVTGDEVRQGKPAPDIYLLAAQRLGVAPQDILALEDSQAGAESALAAGMTVLVVPDLIPPSAELRARVWQVAPSLSAAHDAVLAWVAAAADARPSSAASGVPKPAAPGRER